LRKIFLTNCWNSTVKQAGYKLVAETSCWKVVGTALSQLVNKLGTSLLKKMLLTSFLERHCHNLLTSLLQTCWEKSCWRQVVGTVLSQLVNKLGTSLLKKILLTSFWNGIVTTC
jgi:hypothetical protein